MFINDFDSDFLTFSERIVDPRPYRKEERFDNFLMKNVSDIYFGLIQSYCVWFCGNFLL